MLDGAAERIYTCWCRKCGKFCDESTLGTVRALVVTNMWPSAAAPQRGVFVRDQVEALGAGPASSVDVLAFPSGPRALLRAIATIRRRTRAGAPFDVVHAHFGLAALPALAARRGPVVVTLHGNDLFVRRSNLVTRAALPFTALPAAVSRAFSRNLPGAGAKRRVAVLPVGIALERFRPIPRAEARARLGLDPAGPYLLFPHDPARPLKRFDRAREAAGDVPLLTLGSVAPDEVPVLDQRRQRGARAVAGRGLRAVGDRGAGVRRAGVRHAGRDPSGRAARDRGRVLRAVGPTRWRAALRPPLEAADPRVDGRARAELFSADRMAERVVEAWRELAAQDGRRAAGREAPGLYSALRAHRRPRSATAMSGLLRRIKRSRPADAGETSARGAGRRAGGRAHDGRHRGRRRARPRSCRPRPRRRPGDRADPDAPAGLDPAEAAAAPGRTARPAAPAPALPAPGARADAARPRRAALRGPPHRRRRRRARTRP